MHTDSHTELCVSLITYACMKGGCGCRQEKCDNANGQLIAGLETPMGSDGVRQCRLAGSVGLQIGPVARHRLAWLGCLPDTRTLWQVNARGLSMAMPAASAVAAVAIAVVAAHRQRGVCATKMKLKFLLFLHLAAKNKRVQGRTLCTVM